MTLNLLKLCVGIESIDHLAEVQKQRRKQLRRRSNLHRTRNFPKRAGEIVDSGGSLYWIIKGIIRVRQPILRFEETFDEHDKRHCLIVLKPELIRTELRSFRAFQGWRYFPGEDAPPDAPKRSGPEDEPPPEMAEELRKLGLL